MIVFAGEGVYLGTAAGADRFNAAGDGHAKQIERLLLQGGRPGGHRQRVVRVGRGGGLIEAQRAEIGNQRVELCTGWPSSVRLPASLAFARSERGALATGLGGGERGLLVLVVKSIGASFWRICHSTLGQHA